MDSRRLSKMKDLPPEYLEAKDLARQALDESDPNKASTIIRPFLSYPGMLVSDYMWSDAFALFRDILAPVLDEDISNQIQAVIDGPDCCNASEKSFGC